MHSNFMLVLNLLHPSQNHPQVRRTRVNKEWLAGVVVHGRFGPDHRRDNPCCSGVLYIGERAGLEGGGVDWRPRTEWVRPYQDFSFSGSVLRGCCKWEEPPGLVQYLKNVELRPPITVLEAWRPILFATCFYSQQFRQDSSANIKTQLNWTRRRRCLVC